MAALQSDSVPGLSWSIEVGMGKPVALSRKATAQSAALLRGRGWGRRVTAKTSEQAGGQDSLLSDGHLVLALIEQKQKPNSVSHLN